MTLSPLFRRGLALAAFVIAVDQVTKWWILTRVMASPRVIEVTSFFNLVMTWNRGVSFGMFNNSASWNLWLLPLLALVIAGLLLVWLARAERPVLALGLGAILGGAIGNLVDRLRFGAVADFLDFHVWGFHWPAFNVADAAISIGVTVLIAESLLGQRETRKSERGFGRESSE